LNVEFNEALKWIKSDLRFDIYRDVNCFEMTIRALGNSQTTIDYQNIDELLSFQAVSYLRIT
jgi:hypothetical protein